jgi:hypothetical protein
MGGGSEGRDRGQRGAERGRASVETAREGGSRTGEGEFVRGVPALLALFRRVGFNFSAPCRRELRDRRSSPASSPVARAPGARVALRLAPRISGEVSSEIPPSGLAWLHSGNQKISGRVFRVFRNLGF